MRTHVRWTSTATCFAQQPWTTSRAEGGILATLWPVGEAKVNMFYFLVQKVSILVPVQPTSPDGIELVDLDPHNMGTRCLKAVSNTRI
jgi:hypothetical protein